MTEARAHFDEAQGALIASGAWHAEAAPALPGLGGKTVRVLDGAGITRLDTNGAWLLQRGQSEPSGARLGVGGFLVTLEAGQNRGEPHPRDAASTVGLSEDRRFMYWLVVDGGQAGYSEGATPRETAELLKELGAHSALNLDGGGSTTLVLDDSWRGPRVANRPRSPWITGIQRPVACVLGVRRVSVGARSD